MYKEHPAFGKPDDTNVKIWRYLDFTKFVSLLNESALWFTRSDKLLDDPFEGLLPRKNETQFGNAKDVYKYLYNKSNFFINSWHINQYESAAMWKLYLKSSEGVAIQSTFNQLAESFNDTDTDIFIGKVNYIDYDIDKIPIDNIYYPFLHKRRSFEHEQELRLIAGDLGNIMDNMSSDSISGRYIDLNLNLLIKYVYVAPTAEEWFADLVVSILDKYGMSIEVKHSTLAQRDLT